MEHMTEIAYSAYRNLNTFYWFKRETGAAVQAEITVAHSVF